MVEDELKSVLCAVWPWIGLGGGGDIDNDSECRSMICAVSPIILITILNWSRLLCFETVDLSSVISKV